MPTTIEQQEQFRDMGFTVVSPLLDGEGLAALRQIYDEILRGDVDCGEHDRQLGGITRQVMHPSTHHDGLAKHQVFERVHQAAGDLLGCDDPMFLFDMMIFKPAGHPEPTPWHQDLAYYEQPFAPAGRHNPQATVTFWVAVDDAEPENGCMHFLPGWHTGSLLPHDVASGDPRDESRLLAITEAETRMDLSAAVACPIPAGSATVHGEGTPHYTPPNTSATRARRAYIQAWHDPAKFSPPG
ncbi:MAG TPA: phytanoyl-CoA dioxygenase family protein [Acidimicrobiales bacterium]|nr:phytanoyl-CoA dioxygenase family protein [Acidimicrobiales bacterium]